MPRSVRSDFAAKMYWRQSSAGLWHCFERIPGDTDYPQPRFESLCGREMRTKSGGQSRSRPEVHERCGRCDAEEIKALGAEESLPASKPRGSHNWGGEPNICRFCNKKGARVVYLGGKVHRRCIPK